MSSWDERIVAAERLRARAEEHGLEDEVMTAHVLENLMMLARSQSLIFGRLASIVERLERLEEASRT